MRILNSIWKTRKDYDKIGSEKHIWTMYDIKDMEIYGT
jgi:hypothetical protein